MDWNDSLLVNLIGLFLALAAIFVTYFKWRFAYWKRQNVPYLETIIPSGTALITYQHVRDEGWLVLKRMYDEMKKRKWPHGGTYFFAQPIYWVIDLEYVKNVLTKDFQHFVDRGTYYNEEVEPITAHLFAIGGTKWRNLRTKLTPTFTSGKMKMMFQTLIDCEYNLQKSIESLYKSKQPINIKDLFSRYTMDIIGSCGFGLDLDTFKDDDSPFKKYGKIVLDAQISLTNLLLVFLSNFPRIVRALKIRAVSKDASDFFTKVVNDNVEYREKNNYTRKDFMQLLIDLKNNKLAEEEGYKHDGKTLTNDEIMAQCFIFFVAGYETSSTTMSLAMFELAKNQEIQKKVRNEINKVLERHDGKVTYNAIQEMTYMNQVLDETMRKYPPLPYITRECVKNYKIPGEDVTIEKGTRVIIPILGIHHDEEYYPNPEKFNPDRFNEENSRSRHQYAHLPFGEGPRICIGKRFGLMQSKVGLTSLLRNYNFTINNKTEEPLKFPVKIFVLTAPDSIWLDAQKI